MKPETRIKKQIQALEIELQDRKAAQSKGWKIYLGDPILSQIYCIERDLQILNFRLNKLKNVADKPVSKTKKELEKELEVFQDLKNNKYGVFLGIPVIHKITELQKQINAFLIFIFLVFISLPGSGQRWQDSNKGLFPVSIQGTINCRNTAAGIMVNYLFQNPFFGVPVGLYGSFSFTIKPDLRYINYDFERKLSVGGSITLNKSLENPFHWFILSGAVYNLHPDINTTGQLLPGQHDPLFYCTTKWGVDLGFRIQKGHFTGAVLVDAVNFMRYVQVSAGYSFTLKH